MDKYLTAREAIEATAEYIADRFELALMQTVDPATYKRVMEAFYGQGIDLD